MWTAASSSTHWCYSWEGFHQVPLQQLDRLYTPLLPVTRFSLSLPSTACHGMLNNTNKDRRWFNDNTRNYLALSYACGVFESCWWTHFFSENQFFPLPIGLSSTYPGCPWQKQSKVEYLQLLAEFDSLKIGHYYDTIEISVLGHYQLSTVKNLLKLVRLCSCCQYLCLAKNFPGKEL